MHPPAAELGPGLTALSPRGSRDHSSRNISLSCVSLAAAAQWPLESIISDRRQTQTTNEILGSVDMSSIASPTSKYKSSLFNPTHQIMILSEKKGRQIWYVDLSEFSILQICIGTNLINRSRQSNKSIFIQYSICWCGNKLFPQTHHIRFRKHCDCRFQDHSLGLNIIPSCYMLLQFSLLCYVFYTCRMAIHFTAPS